MKIYTRNLLWMAVASLTIAPVMAQTAASPAAQAAAQPAAGGLEEIVITAQKRTERLQDVPVSASVLSTDAIGRYNAGDISDLNRMVPSVNLNGTINGRVPLGIRGISTVQSEFNVGLASGVAVMVDGIPVPSDSRAANAIEDVQSIEVLKGPQATLGGRTAAQGVINFVTRKPSDTFSGNLAGTATNDGEYRINGFITGPIVSGVDGSLAAYYTTRRFPINNIDLNHKTDEKIYGARGKLLFKPAENLDITLTGRIGQDNSDGFNFTYTHLAPGICILIGPCPPPGTPGFPLGFLEQNVLLRGVTPSFDNLNYASPIDVYSKVKDADGAIDIQYRIGDLTLGSTTSLQHEEQTNVQDLFAVDNFFWNLLTGAGSGAPGTPPPFYNIQTQAIDVRQLSEELKLVSPTDQSFSYLVGLFYSDTKVGLQLSRGLLAALDNDNVQPDTKTTDIYARTTWKFTPDNALVTGLRYNYDQLSYTYQQASYAASFPPPVLYFGLSAADSHSESTVVGDVSLQHFYSPNVMTYVTYSRGYAPAVYNMAQPLTPALPKVGLAAKTNIDNFEIGTKGTYLDNRLTVNATVFYTKYKDFQAQAIVPNGSVNPPSLLVPAGAETKGVELDMVAAPTDLLRLNLNVAYVNAKFTDFADAPCYYPEVAGTVPAHCTPVAPGSSANIQNASGDPMPNAPKWKFTLGAEQRIPVSSVGDVVLGANYSYRSSAQMLADQNPDAVMPSVGLLNLTAGFNLAGNKTSVTLFCNNVTNKVYFTDLEDFWSGPWGNTSAVVGQPARDAHRYLGIRFNQSF